MGKKNKGHKRGILSRLGRKGGSLAGSIVQLLGVLHGLIRGASDVFIEKNTAPVDLPRAILSYYSGVDYQTGGFDQNRAIQSATIIGVTFGVGWALKQIARRM